MPNHGCIEKLKRIQNKASKLILQKGRRQGFPSPIRLQMLHWLSIEKRIIYKLLLLTYYCSRGIAPVELMSLLAPHIMKQDSGSSSIVLFDERFFYPELSYGRRSFEYCAPRLWNSLPLEIRNADTVLKFKRLLKTHFFSSFNDFMQTFNRFRT